MSDQVAMKQITKKPISSSHILGDETPANATTRNPKISMSFRPKILNGP